MKKKLAVAGVFGVAFMWLVSGVDLLRIGIAFVATGALPGMHTSLNPYAMIALAIAGGAAAVYYIFTFDASKSSALRIHPQEALTAKPRRRFMRLEIE